MCPLHTEHMPVLLIKNLSPDKPWIGCSDCGYDSPPGRPRALNPATYCSSTPRIQAPAMTRWHSHLHSLATPIHGLFGLNKLAKNVPLDITRSNETSSSNLSLILYVMPVSYNLHMSKAYWWQVSWDFEIAANYYTFVYNEKKKISSIFDIDLRRLVADWKRAWCCKGMDWMER